jgi:hypothetical protein
MFLTLENGAELKRQYFHFVPPLILKLSRNDSQSLSFGNHFEISIKFFLKSIKRLQRFSF